MKVFGHHFYVPIFLLIVVEFAFAAISFSVCAVIFRRAPGAAFSLPISIVFGALGFGLSVLIGLTAVGLYQTKQRLKIEGVLVRIAVGLLGAATLLALLDFVIPMGIQGRLWVASFALTLVLTAVTRILFAQWFDHEVFQRHILVYGAGSRAWAGERWPRFSRRFSRSR